MAKFNPDVNKTQDPNYLGYSRGISVPDTIKPTGQAANDILPKGAVFEGPKYEGVKHVDETGLYQGQAAAYAGKARGSQYEAEGYKLRAEGIAKAGTGEMLADIAKVGDLAAKATDYTFKEVISDQVYNSSSAIRDNYLTNLTKTAQAVQAGKSNATVGGAVTPATADEALDIVTQSQTQAPEELESLPHQVGGLASARANNKISPTDFYARLNAMAKSYRARYPGYKELIDQTVSKVTGVNPANAEIRSRIADINAAAAKKGDTKTRDRAWLLSHADTVPNGIDLVKKFDQGQIDFYKAASMIQPVLNANAQLDYEAKVAAGADRTVKQQGIDAGKLIVDHASTVATNSLENIKIDTGLDTAEKMTDFMTRYSKGGVNVDTIQWPQLDQLVRQNRADTKAFLLKKYNTPLNSQGDTLMTLHGQDDTQKKVDAALVWHDEVLKSIALKEPGAANSNLNMAKASGTDALVSMFGTKESGAILKIMQAFSNVSPDFAKTMYDAVLSSPDIPQIDKQALIAQIAKLSTPPKSFVTPKGTSLTPATPAAQPSIKEEINKAVDHGMTNEHIKQLIELPQQIFNPGHKDDNVKRSIAASAFDPKNAGLVAQFEVDKMNRGDFVPGQQSIYKSLVNDKMSAEIWRLSQSDPQLWQNYKTFAKDELANGPLKMDIKGINDIRLPPSYKLLWNDQTHQMDVRDAMGRDVLNSRSPLPSPYVKNTIKRINGGLESLASVAKYDKSTDVDVYLLQTLSEYGYNYKEGPISIPVNVMQAIIASRKPPTARK